ncbi:MAG: TIGR02444 family protein [Geminicoccales bacterium]
MSGCPEWPGEPFWDDSVLLYRRPGVEDACLELQRRHGLDVNLLLLCCWLGARGVGLDRAALARAELAVRAWQVEVVRPLRAVRRRLKAKLEDPDPTSVHEGWPDLAQALRRRVLALEIDAERLEQLALGRSVAGLPRNDAPGLTLAARHLRLYWTFDERDRHALTALLAGAFPNADARALGQGLAWLEA